MIRESRNLGDSRGQQGITNLEVSGCSQRSAWGAKLLDWASHSRGQSSEGGFVDCGSRRLHRPCAALS